MKIDFEELKQKIAKMKNEDLMSLLEDNNDITFFILEDTLHKAFEQILDHVQKCQKEYATKGNTGEIEFKKDEELILACFNIVGAVNALFYFLEFTEKEQEKALTFHIKIKYDDNEEEDAKILAILALLNATINEMDKIFKNSKEYHNNKIDLKTLKSRVSTPIGLLLAFVKFITNVFDIDENEMFSAYETKKDYLFKKFGKK